MKEFDITLYINADQMYCGVCSRTISSGLENFFLKKSLLTSIATDFRRKEVRFSLRLKNYEEAESITNECKSFLSEDLGFDCTSYKIDSLDLVNTEIKSLDPNPSSKNGCGILNSIPLLSAGIFLMLAEYFELLPPVTSTSGLIAQTGVGLFSSVVTGWVGGNHFKNAWRQRFAPSRGAMDSLIALGCTAAIVYSFIKIFAASAFDTKDNMSFFDLPLVTLGTLKLSHGIRDKVHAKIEENMDIVCDSKESLPKCVNIYLENNIDEICENPEYIVDEKKLDKFFANEIKLDSVIHIGPDQIVPIDGKIILPKIFHIRETFYGQKGLTSKKFDEVVYAGSVNKSEIPLLLKTICSAEDNYIRKAYASVKINEPNSNMSLENISRHFFRGVLGASIASSIGWLVWGPDPSSKYAAQVFLSMLLSACPCAFGLINVGDNVSKAIAFAAGILVQNDKILAIDQCTDVCFDKCGTLTTGEYLFKQIATLENNISETHQREYLSYAIALEAQIDKKYQSAAGKAILHADDHNKWQLENKNMSCTEFSDNIFNKGRGGYAKINGHAIIVGNMSLLKHHQITINQDWQNLALKYAQQGDLPVFLAVDGTPSCLLILESQQEEKQKLRPHTQKVIQWLVKNNKKIHFLTGDSQARTLVLLEEFSNMPIQVEYDQTPQSKVNYIQKLQDLGKIVIMIGDDQNDSDAIRQANFGIAIDTMAQIRGIADAVLDGSLKGLLQLIQLAKINRRGYQLSLLWAFGFNSLTLLAAAGVLYPKTQMLLDPMVTAVAMAFSSTFLILNIGLFKILGQWAMKKIDMQITQTKLVGALRSPFLSSASASISINSNEKSLLDNNLSGFIEI